MEDEKYLRELGNKVSEMNGKLDQMLDVIPIITNQGERIATIGSSLKNAHKRISELREEMKEINSESEERAKNLKKEVGETEKRIYWVAGAIVASIQIAFSLLNKI